MPKFPLSKPVVGQHITLHAAPADRASVFRPSLRLPIHSTSFFPKLLRSSAMECVVNIESEVACGSNTFLFGPDMTLRSWLGVKHQASIYWSMEYESMHPVWASVQYLHNL